MKQKKSVLTVALVAVLIGAAFLFTACWQGTPAGGSGIPGGGTTPGNTSAPDIEGITWKLTISNGYLVYTLWIEGGDAILKEFVTPPYGTPSEDTDRGSYTITGDIIKFTGFSSAGFLNNKRFKYTVEGDTLTLSERGGDNSYQFKKE